MIHCSELAITLKSSGAIIEPAIRNDIGAFVHLLPWNTRFPTKNRPFGTIIVVGLGEAHATCHAAKKALVESFEPSGLAP